MKAVKILFLFAMMLISADFAFAQTWTPTTTFSNIWGGIATSADGTKLVATSANGIYISTNSGNTWIQTSTLFTNVPAVASSADGNKLIAAGWGATKGPIIISKDSGVTWTQTTAPLTNWYSVASSANGSNLVAVGYVISSIPYGFVYTSTNAGMTWKFNNPYPIFQVSLRSIASSADGSRLVAGSQGTVYTSTNSGTSWSATTLFNDLWNSIAVSADGTKIVAVSQGAICCSMDFGSTWITNRFPVKTFQSGASSANGNKLIVVAGGITNYSSFPNFISAPSPGLIYSSDDSGMTWTSNNAPSSLWGSVAMSADGSKQYATEITAVATQPIQFIAGQIHTFQIMPTPQLSLTPANTNLALSWTIPSTDFVLQQSSDLISWVDMTNAPALNLTNLQNQVMLLPSNGASFYRLKTP
jgi:photosystem II stability/assembly factor-like uncharacterized protein